MSTPVEIVGEVTAEDHQFGGKAEKPTALFTDTSVGRFTLRNGGGEPGYFIFDNTGLACSDIVSQSVASGTAVVVDGNQC